MKPHDLKPAPGAKKARMRVGSRHRIRQRRNRRSRDEGHEGPGQC